MERPSTGNPGNPYLLDTLSPPFEGELDNADTRREFAKKKARDYAGGREPTVNHGKDGEGDCFVCVVQKRVDAAVLQAHRDRRGQ